MSSVTLADPDGAQVVSILLFLSCCEYIEIGCKAMSIHNLLHPITTLREVGMVIVSYCFIKSFVWYIIRVFHIVMISFIFILFFFILMLQVQFNVSEGPY